MKSKLLFAALLSVALFACKNDDETPAPNVEGQITGYDPRDCACCGDWFLQTSDTIFLFKQLPAGSTINLNNATFPLPVKFSYVVDTTGCEQFYNRIILTAIELR